MKTIFKRMLLITLALCLLAGMAACAEEGTGDASSTGSKGTGSTASATSTASTGSTVSATSEAQSGETSSAASQGATSAATSSAPISTTPQPDNVVYRPASANKQVKNLKILFTGDSLTEGDGTSSGYRYQAFRALYGAGITYETVGPYMSDRPDNRLPTRYRKYGGKCGWHIVDIYDKRETVFQSDFDVVCMMIGFNDGTSSYSAANLDYYRKILDYIYERNPNAVVFAMGVAPSEYNIGQKASFSHAPFNAKVQEFCKTYANAGKKIYYVDTWDSAEWNKETCFTDSVHFNETGNGVLASTLAKVAVPILKQMNTADSSYTLPVSPTSITLDKNSVSVVAHSTFGEGVQLTATVTPSNAQVNAVVWGSSDRRVATVDEHGVVRGVGAGTCTVTAYTFDGGIAATCNVTVTDKKGDAYVFNNKMNNAADWTGATVSYFKSTKYASDGKKETAASVSNESVNTGTSFYLSTSVRTYSGSSSTNAGTLDISVGEFTLRLKGKGYSAAVLVGDQVVCEWSNGKAYLDRAKYGVMVENGKVTLMRDGVPGATGTTAAKSYSGN
ncbi:MAG: Ig-like domain-containing protein, partial [Clostridia bacterium]|nr:Ig-like domain-containing protein [Clostridia bacterium]